MATVTVGLDAQLSIEIKQQDKNRIYLGRTRIDEYRADHLAMHQAGPIDPENNQHLDFLMTLYSLLQQDAWFTGLDIGDTLRKAFMLSDILSARDIDKDYDLPIDLIEAGDPTHLAAWEARWK